VLQLKNAILWDVALCKSRVNQRFRAASAVQPPAHTDSLLADFSTLKMETIRSSETSVHEDPHGATSQKTPFFIVTTVKTSNLTQCYNYL
jgi:hypothetical protein